MCTLSTVNIIDVWRISQANAGVIISERIDNASDDNTILIVIAIIKLKFRLYGAAKATDCLEMVPHVEKESPYGTTKKKLDLISNASVAQDKFS